MHVGIIGAGAVGGAIAALLSRAGHTVEITARGAHLDAIRENGIRLRGAWGDHTAFVEASPLLTQPAELVIVTTKAQDADAAIRANAAIVRGKPLLVVQNGLAGVTGAAASAPGSDIVGALAMYAASYLSPGEVTITTPGLTYLGSAGDNDVPARYVASVLGDVMPVAVVADFAGAQWSKLIVNQVNALPAITGRSAQEVIADSRLRRIMTASMREAVRTGLASGIEFARLQSLTHRRLRLFAGVPLWAGQVLPRAMGSRMGSTPNPGSTLQSIRRGQPSEVDYLNGAIVGAAEALGRQAPVNAAMVELVHEVERAGSFFTTDEVVARVGL